MAIKKVIRVTQNRMTLEEFQCSVAGQEAIRSHTGFVSAMYDETTGVAHYFFADQPGPLGRGSKRTWISV